MGSCQFGYIDVVHGIGRTLDGLDCVGELVCAQARQLFCCANVLCQAVCIICFYSTSAIFSDRSVLLYTLIYSFFIFFYFYFKAFLRHCLYVVSVFSFQKQSSVLKNNVNLCWVEFLPMMLVPCQMTWSGILVKSPNPQDSWS